MAEVELDASLNEVHAVLEEKNFEKRLQAL
jgi:hypothetical protein